MNQNNMNQNNFDNLNIINELSTDSEDNDNIINNTIGGGDNDLVIMKKLVNLTVKYEKDLEKINSVKKEVSTKLKKAKQALIPFMKKNEVDFININTSIGGGKLKYNKSKVYSSLSKKRLIELFNAYFKNEDETTKLINFLYENREYKENEKITKTKK
tara:strand:+ start:954 stop:1427 length:474 start_codon:yes stop_codon:yes gene_type:complete